MKLLLYFIWIISAAYASNQSEEEEFNCGDNIEFNLTDEPFQFDLSNPYSIGHNNVLVIRLYMQDKSIDTIMPENTLRNVFDQTSNFYVLNSGGKQTYNFTLYEGGPLHYTRYTSQDCLRGSTTCPNLVGTTGNMVVQDSELIGYDRIFYIYENYCNCYNWNGLGDVVKPRTWCNGPPNLRVLGHELGHNNGARHSNRGTKEYANDFSIMGGSGNNMHFTVAGKISFRWLEEDLHVRTLARPEAGRCFSYENCLQTCTASEPCTFDLYAHDTGSYANNRAYGLRILTEQFSNEHLWIEYRKNYPSSHAASKNGVLAIWSIQYNGVTNYGPTSLEDFNSATSSISDAYIPMGKSWVFDYDAVGAVVTPLSKIGDYDGIQVSIYFTENVALDINYLEDYELGCGTTNRIITLDTNRDYNLYKTFVQNETWIGLTIKKLDCTNFAQDAGLYVYPTYPLQLEINDAPLLGSGAIFYQAFQCLGIDEDPQTATQTFNFTIKSVFSPQSIKGYYVLPFSVPNYLLFYTGSNANVDINVSLNESNLCYSPCSIINVESSDTNAKGNYNLLEIPSTPLSAIFAKGLHKIVVYDGKWVIKDNSDVIAEQLPSTTIPQYPHVLQWTNGFETRCINILSSLQLPTVAPTPLPTPFPTDFPTPFPTNFPTEVEPTPFPTEFPTGTQPTPFPTTFPTHFPTARQPTIGTTTQPTTTLSPTGLQNTTEAEAISTPIIVGISVAAVDLLLVIFYMISRLI